MRTLFPFILRGLILNLGFVLWLSSAPLANAAGISLIRDSEIERIIRTLATPIFKAAGLHPGDVKIYLVNDNTLNAFVAGGQNIFINTGLILRSETALQLIGVIAHETGHIQAGDLSRTPQELAKAKMYGILTSVLGLAAAVGTGRADLGEAIILGGQGTGQRAFLKYSRTQEAAADQAAMRLMDAAGESSEGLLQFLNILERQEKLSLGHPNPYLLSHPLSRERVEALAQHVAHSPYSTVPIPPEVHAMFARMEAKLFAFLNPPTATLRRYPTSDTSLPARYARAIAAYRTPDLAKALVDIEALIKDHPKDGYFWELKGQMLFENAKVPEAIIAYRRAAALLPKAYLIRNDLARALLEAGDPKFLQEAIDDFKASLGDEADQPFIWRQLGIAYGRKGDLGESAVALGEAALRSGSTNEAIYHATKAQGLLPHGSRGWLHAQDILDAAHQAAKNDGKAR